MTVSTITGFVFCQFILDDDVPEFLTYGVAAEQAQPS